MTPADPRTLGSGGRTRPSGAPIRELDSEKTGERAGTPCNLIRRPVQLPPMERIQAGGPEQEASA